MKVLNISGTRLMEFKARMCSRSGLLTAHRSLLTGFVLLLTAHCSLLTGCRRDMQDQPKAIAYRENSFYKDGTGSRPLVAGTVPRGYLRQEREFYSGKKSGASTNATPQTQTAAPQNMST